MAVLHEDYFADQRNYRRAGSKDNTMDMGSGSAPTAVSPLPRLPSTSAMSDSWIDAGIESSSSPQAEQSREPAFASAIGDQRAAPSVSVSTDQATVLPLRPQHTNNPFLRRKSSGAAGQPPTPQAERSHAAAWAELIPAAGKQDAGSSGRTASDGSTHGRAATSALVETGPEPAVESKGKRPALDYMIMPNRQENGRLDEGNSASAAEPPQYDAQEYAPPPGPPPGHEEIFAPPPGPPPQKNETYQIKHIRWLDYTSGDDTRTTPILMQNLNGPCPLLALVNALTMSTPKKRESSLVDALRTREQISLGLLLDAVVEELISNRMNPQAELPDMIELYDFLVALHTGMNVNPAFMPAAEVPNLIDLEPEFSFTLGRKAPGGFEVTKESRLYSTFTIPLIHGWLPPPSNSVYVALKRSARTHEDAENLLTREDELEEKLAKEGLTENEQQMLEDIGSIKYFLNSSATQLTGYGLDIISDTMSSGGFAILFRNNHFSTLHKHPMTGQIFSLVTDMGYAKYPEIIWESLVDTNGLGAELFSGDFRGVSHGSSAPLTGADEYGADGAGGQWSTVDRSGKGKQLPRKNVNAEAGGSSSQSQTASREQEDADLALALQLQEEEEERHRRESTSIRAAGNQQSSHNRRASAQRTGPTIPAQSTPTRRMVIHPSNTRHLSNDNSATSSTSNLTRPARGNQPSNSPFPASGGLRRPTATTVRPADPEASEDIPPPTYESALEEQPYNPPETSQHHHSSPRPSPVVPHAGTNAEGTAVNFDELIARSEADPPLITRARARQASSPQVSAFNQISAESPGARGSMGSAYTASARQRRGSSNVGSSTGPWPQERRDKDRDCNIM